MYDLQKASFWKRISAYLFDFILLGILAVGVAWLMSTVLGFDTHTKKMDEFYTYYEEEYGIKIDITQEEFEKLTEEELKYREEVDKIMQADKELQDCYSFIVYLTLIIVTFGLLVAFVVLEFLVPLLFGNGQTLGKKVFGVAVMHDNHVKLKPFALFVRAILGKYTIETLVPIYIFIMIVFGALGIVGIAVLIGMLILQLVVIATSKTNSTIHDLLAHTVCVDYASQMIFEDADALVRYKAERAREAAEQSDY